MTLSNRTHLNTGVIVSPSALVNEQTPLVEAPTSTEVPSDKLFSKTFSISGDLEASSPSAATQEEETKKAIGTVGLLGGIAIAANTLTGPAMLQLPATFQRSGIIPTTATIIFVSILCNLCALNFANTISKVPGNLYFQREIEYSEAFRIFWGKSWFIFTQVAFTTCILCQLLASIVDTAQVVDTFVSYYVLFCLY